VFVGGAFLTSWKSMLTRPELFSTLEKQASLVLITNVNCLIITRTDYIKDLRVLIDLKLHFHNHVDYTLSQAGKLLGLIRSVPFPILSLQGLLIMYITLGRPRVRKNCELEKLYKYVNIGNFIKLQRLRWMGHLHRIDDYNTKKIYQTN
jgi:hypothetical protein